MASLYRPHQITYHLPDGSYRSTDGQRVTKATPSAVKVDLGPSPVWHGKYKAANGTIRKATLCSDKTASKQMLAKLVIDAKMSRLGMGDPF
jgi:hypothetical protein